MAEGKVTMESSSNSIGNLNPLGNANISIVMSDLLQWYTAAGTSVDRGDEPGDKYRKGKGEGKADWKSRDWLSRLRINTNTTVNKNFTNTTNSAQNSVSNTNTDLNPENPFSDFYAIEDDGTHFGSIRDLYTPPGIIGEEESYSFVADNITRKEEMNGKFKEQKERKSFDIGEKEESKFKFWKKGGL